MGMTHEQILTKAIEIAIARGWGYWPLDSHYDSTKAIKYYFEQADDADPNGGELAYWANIIFSLDFAKALWGKEWPSKYAPDDIRNGTHMRKRIDGAPWQYHLQRMVITEDPIKYLGKHLPEEVKDERA